jgi:acetoin utilization deacetylase AcuC-like enzyme
MDELVYFYPEGHEAHYEQGHPERPDRVEAMRTALMAKGWWDAYPTVEPVPIPEEVLTAIHEQGYLSKLEESCRTGRRFDSDTYVTNASWDLALKAAGGAIAVGSRVWRREAKRGFALTRPPGHHATQNRAMGFCLLNNVALAAEYLLQKEGAQRIVIVDLDLHHGNGTQDIFWTRKEVFYLSTHQSPLYPGTGALREIGAGAGRGTTANFPLPPYSGDNAFQTVMDTLILPLMDRYDPEAVLVSVGFDTHFRDPLGHLILSGAGYGELVRKLTDWADANCQGRIALFLEGGYDLDAAAACAEAAVANLMGFDWEDSLGPAPREEDKYWEPILKLAQDIWQL